MYLQDFLKHNPELDQNQSNWSTDIYPPTQSEEWVHLPTGTYFNNSGQQLRDLAEYDTSEEGYTPFGDE